jgi:hypothetical protein
MAKQADWCGALEILSGENVTSIFGRSTNACIADPTNPNHVFKWLLEQTYDDKGNVIIYEYNREDAENVLAVWPQERNRLKTQLPFANLYLKSIKYGNKKPYRAGSTSFEIEFDDGPNDWMFEVVFDYGEHDRQQPTPMDRVQKWPVRSDPFSSYRAGFEIRTYRLCRRILMFHHFTELGTDPYLVRSTDLTYHETPVVTYLVSATQVGYVKQSNGTYLGKSFPSIDFSYFEPELQQEVQSIEGKSLENLPYGTDGKTYFWSDLDGEGVPGILSDQSEGWFYKRNLGNAHFAPMELVVFEAVYRSGWWYSSTFGSGWGWETGSCAPDRGAQRFLRTYR